MSYQRDRTRQEQKLLRYVCSYIPSFRLRVNSVHLHECSPFWVGIFIIFKKKTNMLTIHMCILLSKVLKHLYICYRKVYYYVNMETYNCPWHLKKKQFQTVYYTHIIEIPTNKGANSYKLIILKIRNWAMMFWRSQSMLSSSWFFYRSWTNLK